MLRYAMTIATLAAFSFSAVAETPNIQPGMWEYTSKTSVEGDFPIPDQEYTNQECVTIEDIEAGEAFMDLEEVEECEVTHQEVRRDGADYSMTCRGPDGTSGDMDMTFHFHGDTSTGLIRSTMQTPMGDINMRVEMEGRRIGDC